MSDIIPATQPGALADLDDGLLIGYEGFVTSGPPPVQRLILINSTKQMGDHEGSQFGEFFDEATGQSYKELDLLLVSISTNRAWLAAYDPNAEQQTVFCRSRNGVKPDAEFLEARAAELGIPADKVACAICPHGRWVDKQIDCADSYRLIAWMPDGTPRIIDARGTSAGPAKKYCQGFQVKGKNLFVVRTKVTTTKMTGANTYFVMNFHAQMDKPSAAEERAEIVKWYQVFGKQFIEQAAARDAEQHVPEAYTGGPTIDVGQAAPAAVPQTNLF